MNIVINNSFDFVAEKMALIIIDLILVLCGLLLG